MLFTNNYQLLNESEPGVVQYIITGSPTCSYMHYHCCGQYTICLLNVQMHRVYSELTIDHMRLAFTKWCSKLLLVK